jgi:hypothetical protein
MPPSNCGSPKTPQTPRGCGFRRGGPHPLRSNVPAWRRPTPRLASSGPCGWPMPRAPIWRAGSLAPFPGR